MDADGEYYSTQGRKGAEAQRKIRLPAGKGRNFAALSVDFIQIREDSPPRFFVFSVFFAVKSVFAFALFAYFVYFSV